MSTTNLSPNTVVPKSGLYYCTMCKEGDSALRDVLGDYAKSKGVDPKMLEGVLGAAGIASNEPTTRKTYKAGESFGECQRHKQATGWTLEREAASVAPTPVEQKERGEPAMMECPPFPGRASCSDNECPCSNTTMPPAKGYLWIKQEIADTRMKCLSLSALQGFMTASGITNIDEVRRRCLPIVVCEQGSKHRGLDLSVAAADYTSWVKTGKVLCRPTPLASAKEHGREQQINTAAEAASAGARKFAAESPKPASASPCAFIVENVFAIRGRGTVATGQVLRGTIRTGDDMFLVREGFSKQVRIVRIETFNRTLGEASTGMSAGLQLQGVEKADVMPCDLVQHDPTERMFDSRLSTMLCRGLPLLKR